MALSLTSIPALDAITYFDRITYLDILSAQSSFSSNAMQVYSLLVGIPLNYVMVQVAIDVITPFIAANLIDATISIGGSSQSVQSLNLDYYLADAELTLPLMSLSGPPLNDITKSDYTYGGAAFPSPTSLCFDSAHDVFAYFNFTGLTWNQAHTVASVPLTAGEVIVSFQIRPL